MKTLKLLGAKPKDDYGLMVTFRLTDTNIQARDAIAPTNKISFNILSRTFPTTNKLIGRLSSFFIYKSMIEGTS